MEFDNFILLKNWCFVYILCRLPAPMATGAIWHLEFAWKLNNLMTWCYIFRIGCPCFSTIVYSSASFTFILFIIFLIFADSQLDFEARLIEIRAEKIFFAEDSWSNHNMILMICTESKYKFNRTTATKINRSWFFSRIIATFL